MNQRVAFPNQGSLESRILVGLVHAPQGLVMGGWHWCNEEGAGVCGRVQACAGRCRQSQAVPGQ